MQQGSLFVISGPSGAGKGTLVALLCQRMDNCWLSVSATTRSPRDGELDGTHYFFLSDFEFDRLVEEDGFLEYANVHSYRYGTPRASVQEHLSAGQHVILEIDVQGGLQVKSRMPQAHLVFIEPPSLDVLRERLVGRGTEKPEEIDARLAVAQVELSEKMKYDYTLMNDNLLDAADELEAYVRETIDKDVSK